MAEFDSRWEPNIELTTATLEWAIRMCHVGRVCLKITGKIRTTTMRWSNSEKKASKQLLIRFPVFGSCLIHSMTNSRHMHFILGGKNQMVFFVVAFDWHRGCRLRFDCLNMFKHLVMTRNKRTFFSLIIIETSDCIQIPILQQSCCFCFSQHTHSHTPWKLTRSQESRLLNSFSFFFRFIGLRRAANNSIYCIASTKQEKTKKNCVVIVIIAISLVVFVSARLT